MAIVDVPVHTPTFGTLAIGVNHLPAGTTVLDVVEARLVARLGGRPGSRDGQTEGCPLTHRFTPGLYTREIFMPAGTIITSKIHKTEHPFVVSKGRLWVLVEGGEWEHIEAPHTGITRPGTRRLLFVEEDTIWTTFHPTPLTDLDAIEAAIIEPHTNPLLERAADGGVRVRCLEDGL